MGYLRHECIVVSGWDTDRVCGAHAAAGAIFNAHGMGSLVGGLTRHAINGGAAFMIAPDGSKEGWAESDTGDKARAEFIAYLKSEAAQELYLDWALLLVGGDDGEYRVLDHPNADAQAGVLEGV